MNWLILTLLAVLSRAIYGIASKVFSTHVPVSAVTQSVILTGVGSLLAFAFSPLTGGISFQNFHHVWIIALIMVISQIFGNLAYFKGIEKLEASITQIAFSSIVIWGAFLSSFLLGSHFALLQILGIILLVGAIFLIQYKKGKVRVSIHIAYIFIAAACFAVFQVTSAQLAQVMSAGTYLLLAYLGSAVLLSLLYWKKVAKEVQLLFKNVKNVLAASLFASGTSLFYFLFSYFAYRVAPDRGVVVLLLTTQVIVSVILGILFLKERDRIKQKIVAGILTVIASVMIKS